jgi:uncharacterized lipoprotein YddW (UPF0748 family)
LSPILAAWLLTACTPGTDAGKSTADVQLNAPTGDGIDTPDEPPTDTDLGAVTSPDESHWLTAPGTRPRGLWVLAEGTEQVLEDAQKLAPLVTRARALGTTDLFVQVYRGGRAWYDATLADPTPYTALVERNGVDTLAELIDLAHSEGLRVHAWANVLSLSHNKQAPILEDLGREAILVDRHGRSILDYPSLEVPLPDGAWYRMGTRGVYLDAAAPGVAERLIATLRELVERYPQLDGLHLDYIRQPGALPFVPGSRFGVGLDFGYGEASVLRFQRETRLSGPYRDSLNPDPRQLINANSWDDWRRDKVTELVAGIRAATLEVRPGLVISAAVNSYVDRAYLSLAQDWKRWLEEGLIDLAVPMVYTRDDRLLRYQLDAFARAPHGDRIWTGLGTWLFASRPAGALHQIELARAAGTRGDALFSYDAIAERPALEAALVEGLRGTPERPPGEAPDVP